MQRHRNEQISANQHLGAGAVHPAPESPGRMGPVTVLQPEHQVTAVPVVAQHRARPIPAAPLAGAGPTRRILTHRVGKRRTA